MSVIEREIFYVFQRHVGYTDLAPLGIVRDIAVLDLQIPQKRPYINIVSFLRSVGTVTYYLHVCQKIFKIIRTVVIVFLFQVLLLL